MTPAPARLEDSAPLFATPRIVADRHADGSIWVRSTVPLQPSARCVGDWLEQWAARAPDRIFLGERRSVDQPWTTVTYAEALHRVRKIGAWVLARKMSPERPLVILSDNSIDHALFALGAMHVGVPVAAVSPAYSLVAKEFDKLKSMIALLDPGAIYVASLKPFAAALAAIAPAHNAQIVSGEDAPAGGAIAFRDILETVESADVAQAFAAVGPDTSSPNVPRIRARSIRLRSSRALPGHG